MKKPMTPAVLLITVLCQLLLPDRGSAQIVAAGGSRSLVVCTDGSAMAWGRDDHGQLGNGINTPSINVPVPVSSLTGVTAITGGGSHSLALVLG